jgi:fructose-1,6-bisphosphatase
MDATSTLLGIAVVVLLVLLLFGILKSKRLERLLTERTQEMTKAREELGAVRLECERTVVEVQKLVDQQRAALDLEAERVRQHFDGEARKAKAESDEALKTATKQIEALSRYQRLIDEEGDATRALAEALTVATSLKSQASGLLEAARDAAIQ